MWFKRRQPKPSQPQLPASPPPVPLDLSAAIETVLVKAVDSQMNLYERISRLTAENLQLALAAQQKSQKRLGGMLRSRSAARNAKGQMVVECRLCRNPAIPDPTPKEILDHQNHRQPKPKAEPKAAAGDDDEYQKTIGPHGEIIVHVPDEHIQTDAQGNEVIECDTCLNGQHEH